MPQSATFVPVDGRLTSLQVLNIALTGSEVMEIVAPGTAEEGNNFQVTLDVLGTFFATFGTTSTVIITSGATLVSPYSILTTTARILLNKTAGSPSYLVAPLAAGVISPSVLIKDFKGDAFTNNITVTFTGGELCDGQSQVVIDSAYGWATINPTPGGGSWYQS